MRAVATESPAPESFAQVWERVVRNSGAFFQTKGGRYFTYTIDGDFLLPSHTDLRIRKDHFALAYQIVPIPGAGKIARVVDGPEYVWAILHDERISRGRW